MAEERAERRLAAILAADVVGYSRLMEKDEERTHAAFLLCRAAIAQIIADRHGRIFGGAGDSVMAEFASAVEAVRAGVEIQKRVAGQALDLPAGLQMQFRIGINLGDVMADRGELFGDGINIAARLQAMAEPGGICLSGSVHEQIAGKVSLMLKDLGLCEMKNIAKPVRVYRAASEPALHSRVLTPPALPDKPSIVVLPFVNISADTEQAFFVDGLTEDLITDLSKVPSLFVIARNSSFAYRNGSIDVRQIARELGVKYVLEGSARRAAGRVRINAQLLDAAAGGHIWAERFDRDLADVFAVQDEVIGKIVEALVGRLTAASLPERYRPANLEAYDLCLRGRAEWAHSAEAGVEACPLFERAVALDPNYAEAYRWLAAGYSVGWLHMNRPMVPFRQRSIELAKKAVELDRGDSGAHWMLAFVLLYERQWDESAKEFEESLRLNPNEADAWSNLADLKVMEGRGAEAVACVEQALRLNPHPPSTYYWDMGQAQYAAGQYEAAVETLRNEATYRTGSRRFLAAALGQLGRLDEAREEARLFLIRHPHFRIQYWAETQPFRDLAMREKFVEGYRKAGLPE